MFTAIIATILAAAAITSNGVTFQPFVRGMDRASHVTVSPEFIGLEWKCSAGGGKLRHNDEICFAGLEAGELVTGP